MSLTLDVGHQHATPSYSFLEIQFRSSSRLLGVIDVAAIR